MKTTLSPSKSSRKTLFASRVILATSVFILAGCATAKPYSANEAVQVQRYDRPNPSIAYFLVSSEGIPEAGPKVIIFKTTQNKRISIDTNPDPQIKLVKVLPGDYSTDFGLYTWDMFYWYRGAEYQIAKEHTKPFTVEANTVYYIGHFTDTSFTVRADYNQIIADYYPGFADVPVIVPFR